MAPSSTRCMSDKEDVDKFILAVKKREWLWNPSHDQFTNKAKVYSSWYDISKEFNEQYDVHILKWKWKNLRDVYRRELKRHLGKNNEYKGQWRFFWPLKFIYPVYMLGGLKKSRSKREEPEDSNEEETSYLKTENETDETRYFETTIEENNYENVMCDVNYDNSEVDDSQDYDLMFLKSMLPFFKLLDPLKKLAIRTKMQELLMNELTSSDITED